MTGPESHGFSRKSLSWIIGLSVGSFALAILLTAFAEDLSRPWSAGADAFSYSALGHRGVVAFLSRMGVQVIVRQSDRLTMAGPQTPLIVAEPPPSAMGLKPEASRLAALADHAKAKSATLIVILPKWLGLPNATKRGWLGAVEPIPPDTLTAVLSPLGSRIATAVRINTTPGDHELACETAWQDTLRVSLTDANLVEPALGIEPLVTCGGRALVAGLRGEEGGPRLILVSDPDIINNQGLGRGDNARVIHDLLVRGLSTRSVVWDETIHGFTRASGFASELFRFPLVMALAHGCLLLGLVLLAGIGRFGKPKPTADAVASGKQTLIDNTAKLMSMAGDTADGLREYFDQTVHAVATHYFLPSSLSEDQLRQRLREIGVARGVGLDIEELGARTRAIFVGPRKDAGAALGIAVRLHRWREEMTHVD